MHPVDWIESSGSHIPWIRSTIQTFSFDSHYVCRLTKSEFTEPVNIGSDEMVSMNEMAEIVLSFDNKSLPIHHIPGPEGVRGRNSDNTLIKEKLGWAPSMKLKVYYYYYPLSMYGVLFIHVMEFFLFFS